MTAKQIEKVNRIFFFWHCFHWVCMFKAEIKYSVLNVEKYYINWFLEKKKKKNFLQITSQINLQEKAVI